ncbi:uncharacterized protein LOC127780242, partial [Oryza glaberrima]|uniref:uncharacterized protein LOC127780242 n=1 Tax=Oryza glaberrima TaxID=4538 RepID=UPI00224BEA7A
RRLLKLFARLAVLGSPTKRRTAAADFRLLPRGSPISIVPAVIVIVGAASIPDTPNSFALRGRLDEARDSLRCIRRAWAATATSTPSSRISSALLRRTGDDGRGRGGIFTPLLFYTNPPLPPTQHDFAVCPGVDAFLATAACAFELVVFTAGLPEYASLVLDRLDPRGILFAHRLYRGACCDTGNGRLVKDLAAADAENRTGLMSPSVHVLDY